eukprot:jgi/Mesvir1/11386/Mv10285-RA.1
MSYTDDDAYLDGDDVSERDYPVPMDASDEETDAEAGPEKGAVTDRAGPHRVFQVKPLLDLLDRTRHAGWPERVDTCCWWCCHPFDTVPCALPIKYREGKGFTVKGCFCSFSCVKAYNTSDSGQGGESARRTGFIFLMCLRLWKMNPRRDARQFRGVITAPPRTCLKMFGGT